MVCRKPLTEGLRLVVSDGHQKSNQMLQANNTRWQTSETKSLSKAFKTEYIYINIGENKGKTEGLSQPVNFSTACFLSTAS